MATKYISPDTIEEIAASIRADFPNTVAHDGICEVDILKIAEGLGCEVQEVDFTPSSVKAKVQRNAQPSNGYAYTIQVSRRDSLLRQKFSIAHEISHIVLHDDGKNKFIERRQALIDYRESEIYKETQANMLAAALLMPKEQLIKLWDSTKSVDEVAAIYGVTVEAVADRISDLGLLDE